MEQNELGYIDEQDAVEYLEDMAISSDFADVDDISNNVTYLKDLLKVLQILKNKKVDLEQIRQYLLWKEKFEKISINKLCLTYNRGKKKNRQLTEEEMQLIVDWLKEV